MLSVGAVSEGINLSFTRQRWFPQRDLWKDIFMKYQ